MLLSPTQATAQSADPFAISKDLTIDAAREAEKDGPGLTLAYVDGRELKRMVDLRWLDERLAIDAESAEMAGIPLPEGASGFLALDDLAIANWSFDRQNQRLMVKLFRKSDGPNDVNVARRNFEPGERSPLLAGLVDYSLFASASGGETQFAASVIPRLTYGNFNIAGAVNMTPDAVDGQEKLVRLDTTATLAIPARNLVVRAGDVFTAGADGQRSLRIGGLQIGTDFELRPDLITFPVPEFSGSVAVPTSVDLMVNDQRFLNSDLEAGDFRVHNIPVAMGRGEVAVVLRDEFGRETIQSTRLYVSRSMLAQGLWEGAANIGWLRRRYGQVSNDYRDTVGTFFVRRGLSRSLSAGVSGEGGLGVWNIGAQAEATIADVALAFGEVRYSHTSTDSGMLFRGGIESSGPGISGRLEAIVPTQGYADIASQTGDDPVTKQFLGSLDFDLGRATRLQVSAARQERLSDPRFDTRARTIDFARATFRHELRKGVSLSADLSYRRAERSEVIAAAGVSIRFGGRKSMMGSVRHDGDSTWGNVGFYRPDIEEGDFGYAVRASFSENTRLGAAASYRANFARFQGEVEHAGGDVAVRGMAQGTVIFADNQLFARTQSSSSYALVRTGGVEGVAVTYENRDVGKTGKHGRLLVANVQPLVPMQFDIDPDELPTDAVARSTYRRVVVSRDAVALVDMDVEAYRSQLVRVTDARGAPLAIGTKLVAQPSGREYTVAFDGIFDFNALSKDDYLLVGGAVDTGCRIVLPDGMDPNAFEMPELVSDCPLRNIAMGE